jgi:hypothetical protein
MGFTTGVGDFQGLQQRKNYDSVVCLDACSNRDCTMMAGHCWRCVSAQRTPFKKTPFWKYCMKPSSISSPMDTRGLKRDRDRIVEGDKRTT